MTQRAAILPLVASATLVGALLVARAAAADPTPARVVTAPTAWLPDAGVLTGTISADVRSGIADRRPDGGLVVGYGVGGLAALELGADSDVGRCTVCDTETRASPAWLG
nr:hypothetical protein [Deltaproteobacteria bacterium]